MYPYHLESIGVIVCGNLKEIHLLMAVICGIILVMLTSFYSIQLLALTYASPLSSMMCEWAQHVPISSLSPADDVFIFNRHK